ncbi:MAG: GspH/FimT family pseudopilin [Candidatus Rokubacteria bacterium]|nr:GspH/FimT family pseudopilin [Candidatus Rokubacteria bacterium]
MTEVVIATAVVAILGALTIPVMGAYFRSATVAGAAQEMRSALRRARQLAITGRQTICVHVATPAQYELRAGGCANAPLQLPGANATGAFALANGVRLSNAGPDVAFTATGAAAPGGQFVVNGAAGERRTVTVSPTGRIVTP